jgi:hypothetical protein
MILSVLTDNEKEKKAGTPTLPDVLLAKMLRSKRAPAPTKMYSTPIIVLPVT